MTAENVSVDVLRALHRIHRQLTDLNERLGSGPRKMRACEVNVNHREEQIEQVRAGAKALRVATDAKQLQLKVGEDKIEELKGKLNMASSNREYQALKDQIAAQKMTNSVLDDEILEGWDKIEALDKKVAEAQAVLAQAQQNAEKVRREVTQQEPLIQGDLERLQAELGDCEATLPATAREAYDRVVRQRGEDALAEVENQYCGGCHQHVPLNVCAEILLSHPMFCKSCGRLLYMPEESSARK